MANSSWYFSAQPRLRPVFSVATNSRLDSTALKSSLQQGEVATRQLKLATPVFQSRLYSPAKPRASCKPLLVLQRRRRE